MGSRILIYAPALLKYRDWSVFEVLVSPLFRGPWSALYALSLAVLTLSYAGVSLFALWVGYADFAFPLKITLLFTIAILLLESIDRVRTDHKINPERQLPSLQSSLLLIVGLLVLVGAIFSFLSNPFSVVLIKTDILVRALSTIALIGPIYYALLLILEVWKIYRKSKEAES